MTTSLFKCRICNSTQTQSVLSLGVTPLANALLTATQLNEPEPHYPLDLVFCPNCTLIQITETVPPEILFANYFYFSSFSDTMLKHAEELCVTLIGRYGLDQNSLVLEIASNDGYLLQNYHQQGIPVLGIEPAQNIAQVAQERGINTLTEFFGNTLAKQLSHQGIQADVIHANNVLAHVADLDGVVAGLRRLLKPTGVAVIEVPYLKDLIDRIEFDTIYHEHLCYFSLTALNHLFQQNQLVIVDVERIPIHGGSLRVFVAHAHKADVTAGDGPTRVQKLLANESVWGVDKLEFYRNFGSRVKKLKTDLLNLLKDKKAQGKQIAVYGASAKGSTLLNYFGIGRETLDFVVDRSTVKQNHYTPGTHLPIYAPEKLLEEMPDYVLLLTWNFADEILAQQEKYRQQGGKFIIPIPQLRVV